MGGPESIGGDPTRQDGCVDPESFKGIHDYLVCIDSDGCVFDNMVLKHKACFFPAFMRHFRLEAMGDEARDTWDFVNLSSHTRGTNRFKALLEVLRLLKSRSGMAGPGAEIPALPGLAEWVSHESQLSASALEKAYRRSGDPDIGRALEWSRDVDREVERIVRGKVPPFGAVKPFLEAVVRKADILVVSQGPVETISRDWTAQGLDGYPRIIIGHESGTKCECIRLASSHRYLRDRILMIGDAPGDLEAARGNGSLFFPIMPGKEERSWRILLEEGIDRFFAGRYRGEYSDSLIADFEDSLPAIPPWNRP